MPSTSVRLITCSCIVLLAAPLNLNAQFVSGGAPSPAGHGSRVTHAIPVPVVQAVRKASSIVIDGKLDDAAWREADPITQFAQSDPSDGQPATQRTEVRFLFDENALYVGARMHDSQDGGVRTQLVRRDASFDSDWLQLIFDGYHDHLSNAVFVVNPSGSRQDRIGVGSSCCDAGWDPVYELSTRIDADGWTAEMRIPLSQLRFPADSIQTWGLQVRRFIQRNNEQVEWSHSAKNETGGPARFGHLEGLRIARSVRRLELLPYVVARSKNVRFVPGDPYNDGSVQSVRAGFDLKYLLTSNLTLDATFNPDFGQVEVDPAVVNLSAFENFFPEKRPFFIEGSGVFGFGGLNCYFCSNISGMQAFYSRRIGRAPTGADLATGAGAYAAIPDASTILGATKITGRVGNGLTFGILDAVTGEARADVARLDGTRLTQAVEPLTNFLVGRAKKDFLGGNLVIGAIGTSVVRKLDDAFRARLAAHAELAGTDFQYMWHNRAYKLSGELAVSSLGGDRAVISARQRSSARYFQRPDRGSDPGLFGTDRLDTLATSMVGAGATLRLGKDAGDWLWELQGSTRTPGFETNDYSFLTSSDLIWANGNIRRQWLKPTQWYRALYITAGGQSLRNWDGDGTDGQLHVSINGTASNFWPMGLRYVYHPRALDDRLLRGGPIVVRPGSGSIGTNLQTDARLRAVFSNNANYFWDEAGGWGASVGTAVRYRPSPGATLSFGPSWSSTRSPGQYVTRVTDATATEFYGSRYVMSTLKQQSLGLDTRLNVTFTPRMTLEFYAQPFIASGAYFDFKEYDTPRTNHLSTYGVDRGTIATARNAKGHVMTYRVDPDGVGPAAEFSFSNPDFNLRSVRGNAVFRWEYHPGSVLYVAWTHSQSDVQPFGDFDLSRDQRGLFAGRPDNILLVKASWWYSR